MLTVIQKAVQDILAEENAPKKPKDLKVPKVRQRTRPVKLRIPENSPHPHGNHNTYYTYGCRCEPCRVAGSTYAKTNRDKHKANPSPNQEHGKATTYKNEGCRCAPCRQAMRAYQSQFKESPEAKERRNQYKREQRRLAKTNG